MTDTHVVSALKDKRIAIASQIESLQGQIRQAVIALDHVEAKCAGDYQQRISGPLFDRIDLHVDVAAVSASDLALPPPAEGNAEVAARVARARKIQRDRFKDHPIRTNAEAEGELLDAVARPDTAGSKLLTDAAERMKLSARGYHRVLRVSRTIADLAGVESVAKTHIAEALSYRRLALA